MQSSNQAPAGDAGSPGDTTNTGDAGGAGTSGPTSPATGIVRLRAAGARLAGHDLRRRSPGGTLRRPRLAGLRWRARSRRPPSTSGHQAMPGSARGPAGRRTPHDRRQAPSPPWRRPDRPGSTRLQDPRHPDSARRGRRLRAPCRGTGCSDRMRYPVPFSEVATASRVCLDAGPWVLPVKANQREAGRLPSS